jgi:hypothetical protein
MITCQMARDLIEKLIDGTIPDDELGRLKAHAETCAACREEFHRCVLMTEVVQEALAPQTDVAQARVQVMARLSEGKPLRSASPWLIWARPAVAAGIVLAAGLLVGFVLGRTDIGNSRYRPSATPVPMRVSRVEGTVLVRHDGTDVWRTLNGGADVYLGDTFHSTAGSDFVLELGDSKSTIKVNQNSMLALVAYGDKTEFSLDQGECTASLESPHGPFFVRTPHGRVEALGTEFTVSVTDE